MIAIIRRFTAPPSFDDEDKARTASLLNLILWSMLGIALLYFLVAPFLFADPLTNLLGNVATIPVYIGILFLMRRGRVRLASMLFSFLLWTMVTLVGVAYGGANTPAYFSFFTSVLVAGLLLGARGAMAFAALSLLSTLGLLLADLHQLLPPAILPTTAAAIWWIAVVNILMASVLLSLSIRGTNLALRRVRQNEETLAQTISQLEENAAALHESLEITAHSQRLLLSLSEVGHAIQRAGSQDDVYRIVTDEIAGLGYQAVIFTASADGRYLEFAYSTFDPAAVQEVENLAGLAREALRFPLARDTAFGQLALQREPIFMRFADDFIHELLPADLAADVINFMKETQTIGAPVAGGENLHGVLFVIGSEVRETDIRAISVLVNQMGVALENAKLYSEVQRSEAYYRSLIENALDIVAVLNSDGTIRYQSPAVENVLGLRPTELIGQTIYDFVHQDDLGELQDLLATTFHLEGPATPVEVRFRHRDGTWRVLEVVSNNLTIDPVVAGIVINFRDITGRKQAEETATRLGQILDDSLNEIYIFHAKTLRFIQVNQGARDNLGYTMPELAHMTPLNLTPEYTFNSFAMLLKPLRTREKDKIQFTTAHQRKDSSLYPVEVHLQLSTFGPAPLFVAIVLDISERREAEKMIRQQDRLAAVGQMAAGIAHDFNNVMAVITLYSELLLNSATLIEKERQQLQIIRQQASRAAELTGQILDFSRQSVMKRRPVDLLPFLQAFVKLLARTLPEKITLALKTAEEAFVINADLTRIQQAIMNLALNARDAMPEGGNLTIRLGRLSIPEEPSPRLAELRAGEWIRIDVSDDGGGVSPELLPHLFEPFFTTKPPGEGTGLGLAQVYGIVKQHDGHVVVDSVLDQGTTFTIYLPAIAAVPPQKDAAAPGTPVQGHGELILIVEDDLATRSALADGVQSLNYRVITAPNGREALALLEGHLDDIALVLSDVIMPDAGGLELLWEVRARRPALPVVLLTGHPLGDEQEIRRPDVQGARLSKPVSLDELAQVLARYINED